MNLTRLNINSVPNYLLNNPCKTFDLCKHFHFFSNHSCNLHRFLVFLIHYFTVYCHPLIQKTKFFKELQAFLFGTLKVVYKSRYLMSLEKVVMGFSLTVKICFVSFYLHMNSCLLIFSSHREIF